MAQKPEAPPSGAAGVINWATPEKKELVERALSDGQTDPAKIAEWAKDYKVNLTVEEVQKISAELARRHPKGKKS